MRQRALIVIGAACGLSTVVAFAWAGLSVTQDKENVVGSRIEGAWRPHAELTRRLTGDRPDRESPDSLVRFKLDLTVAAKVPAKYDAFLGKKQIYQAGLMTWRGKAYPFLLIEHRGNPHVVFFRERDGDPMGDAESFNVMLAKAADAKHDLLFIGGDFNNSPFKAFERAAD